MNTILIQTDVCYFASVCEGKSSLYSMIENQPNLKKTRASFLVLFFGRAKNEKVFSDLSRKTKKTSTLGVYLLLRNLSFGFSFCALHFPNFRLSNTPQDAFAGGFGITRDFFGVLKLEKIW